MGGWVIHTHNKALQSDKKKSTEPRGGAMFVPTEMQINFVGLAVGDPVLHAEYQWPTYADTLYGMGLVMLDEREQLRTIFANGVAAHKKWAAGEGDCWTAFQYWNSVWEDDSGGGLPGKFCSFTGSDNSESVLLGGQPPEFDHWTAFLAQSNVATAMHCNGSPSTSRWEGGEVYHTMVRSGDFCQNSSHLYAQ